jgi:hypothetical protein
MDVKRKNIQVRQMPIDLWRLFKSRVDLEGLTVEDSVIEAIEDWIKKHMRREVNPSGVAEAN